MDEKSLSGIAAVPLMMATPAMVSGAMLKFPKFTGRGAFAMIAVVPIVMTRVMSS